MKGTIIVLISALALAKPEKVRVNRNGCPIDVTSTETLLPHENCNQYYQCVKGALVKQNCPGNLLFNPDTLVCDRHENVNCHRDTKVTASSEAVVNSNPKQATTVCAADDSDGKLVAHEHCNQFYQCWNGKPVALSCYGHLNYNPDLEICDWPNQVDCGARIIPENNNDADEAPIICASEGTEELLVAHRLCNKFYKCHDGKPISYKCPGDLLYNINAGYCDCAENVACGEREVEESNAGDNESNASEENDNNSNVNDDPSEAPTICASEGSDGTLIAHENCRKFYKCANGIPTEFTCYGELLFNPSEGHCEWPGNVDCGDRIIPVVESEEDNNGGSDNGAAESGSSENEDNDNGNNGNNENNGNGNDDPSQAPAICAADGSEGVFVAHENCNQFYVCVGGKPVSLTCPGILLFDPQTGDCEWPEKVQCGDRLIPAVESEEDNNGGSDNGAAESGSSENEDNDNGNNGNNENNGNGNDDPSQAPAICAADGSEGVFVAHENCNQFYVCVGGKPVSLTCPGILLFDPQTGDCEWPEKVQCGDRLIPAVESEEDNNGGSDNGAAESGSSENEDNDNGNNGNNENNGNGNDDPSQAPAICAADGSEGVFVAHENCNQFYVCVGGKPVSLTCPGILLFDPQTGDCEWPEKVQCGDRLIPAVESEEDNNGGSDNGAAESGSSENEDNDSGNHGNNENNGNGNDDPSQAPAICAADGSEGVFVAHENCNQFYVCVGGKPVSLTCPGILLFDPQTGDCEWPEKVQCGDRLIPAVESEEDNNGGSDNGAAESGSSENEDNDSGNNGNNENNGNGNDDPSQAPAICAADGSEGVFVAHENCNQFYVCVGGKPVSLTCPGILLFDPQTGDCEWPEKVQCGDRLIPAVESEEDNNGGSDNGAAESGSSENEDNDSGNNGNNENNGNGNDDPSQAPAICAADDSEGVFVAHENCNQFYVCVGGRPVSLTCPGILLFDPQTGDCEWPEKVQCGDRLIPAVESEEDNNGGSDNGAAESGSSENEDNDSGNNGNNENNGNGNDDPSQAPAICAADGSEGFFVAHENCNQFYVCVGGKPVSLTCPGILLFDPQTGGCEWPEKVQCGDRLIPAVESEEDNNGGSDNGAAESGSSENEDNDSGNNGNNENNGNGNDDPSQAPAICAADGSESVFVAHENCNQFYVCVGGKPVSLTCPGILLFDPQTSDCEWPEKVQCGDRLIPAVESEEDNNGGSDNGAAESGSSENEDNDSGNNGNNENNGNGNDDPSQAPAICAADGSEGVFVAHENCNQFYVCVGGRPVSLTCPGILLFDPQTGDCEWPEKVQCGDRLIPAVESEEDNNGGSDNGAAESGSSENEDNDSGNNGNNENNGNGNDDPSQAPAICAADGSEGVFVAHENCNQFYVCVGGKPVSLTCPGILLFDPQTGDCKWPEKVQCGDRLIPAVESEEDNNGGSDNGAAESGSSENEDNDSGNNGNNENNGNGNDDPSQAPAICAADGSEGVFVAHENCNQFYVCVGGRPVSLTCPGILLFDPQTGDCEWPEKVQCGDRLIPAVESEEDNNGGSDNGAAESGSSENEDNDSGNNGNNENNGNGNDDPSQAPAICAADGSEGFFVAHENCNQFYVCVGGKPVSLTCPGILLFDPQTGGCEWPEKVQCGDRLIPAVESEEDNNGGSDNGAAESGSSENEDNDSGNNGNNENNGNGNDDPSQAPAICTADGSEGVFVAHENCNQFYVCVGGKPVSLTCPGILLFDPQTGDCEWPEKVQCGDRLIPAVESEEDNNGGSDNGAAESGSSENEDNDSGNNGNNENNGNGNDDPSQAPAICAADGSEGVFVAHENCNQFYVCVGGKPVSLTCPGILLFDPQTSDCEWPEKVQCGDRLIPAVESEEDNNGGSDNGAAESGSSENEDNDNGNNGNNENNGNGNDDPSQAPAICAADGSEGVFVAHENCNQFYVCVGGKPVSLTCPGILLFDPQTSDCEWPEKVQCGDRLIPAVESEEDNNGGSDNGVAESGSSENEDNDNGNNGNGNDDPSQAPAICAAGGSEGMLVAHENCNQFYVCVGGKPVSLTCPGTLLFDPQTGDCQWSDKVQCGDRIIPAIESEEDNNGGSDNGPAESGSSENEDNDSGNNGNNENNGNGNDDPSQAPAICAADGSEGFFVAHENCNQFYVCVGGKPVSLTCPGILLFDPQTGGCEWPEKVQCGDRLIPAVESEEDNNGGSDNGVAESGSSENEDNDSGNNGNNENNGNGNDDPSQAPAICAADGSEGVFVAHENCNQFYVCVGGKPVSLTCPGTLLFDPQTGDCQWSDKVQCGDRIIPAVESEEDNNGGSDNGAAESGSSENEDNDNGNNGNNENNGNGYDDPSQAPAICAADGSEGVLVAHENCNQFYVCVGGKPVSLTCPGTLLFDPQTGDCEWSDKVQCGDRIIPVVESEEDNNGGSDNGAAESGSSENEDNDNGNNENNGNGNDDPSQAPAICAADGSEGVLVAHENCNQFYVCVGGKPVSLTCPGTLLFDPQTGDCEWSDKIQCGDRIIPVVESEEDNNGGSDNGAADSGSSENEDNDNGNNENNGNGHNDPSQASAICAADGSDGVFVAHENCNQFYVCVGREPVTLDCPPELWYSPSIGHCDWKENVICGDRIEPDSESEGNNSNESNYDTENGAVSVCAASNTVSEFIAHRNCSKFYVCAKGISVILDCPLGLMYDANTKLCDWPDNVNCSGRIVPEVENDSAITEIDSSSNEKVDNDDVDDDLHYGIESSEAGKISLQEAAEIACLTGLAGTLLPHDDCNKFYMCMQNRPLLLQCATTQLFSSEKNICDRMENVDCGSRSLSLAMSFNKHLESRKALRNES